MKTYAILLSLAVSLLTLPGCVEDKPAPRLTSPDREERLEAVRAAQNQYGAQPAAADPNTPSRHDAEPAGELRSSPLITKPMEGALSETPPSIVGRWNLPWRPWAHSQFNADGTFHMETLTDSANGTYRLLPEGVLQLTMRRNSVPKVIETKYRFNDDRLELWWGYWLSHVRAK
jgi:hypothetical protein